MFGAAGVRQPMGGKPCELGMCSLVGAGVRKQSFLGARPKSLGERTVPLCETFPWLLPCAYLELNITGSLGSKLGWNGEHPCDISSQLPPMTD